MSEDAREIVRRAYEFLNRGDVDGFVGLCAPDFRLDMSERTFNAETYEGHDGIRRFYADVRDVWAEYRWDVIELVEAGEQVVALLRAHGRGRGSGLEVDRRIAMNWTVSGGRAASVRLYVDSGRAIEAARAAAR